MDGLVSKDINELFVKVTTRTYLNKLLRGISITIGKSSIIG